MQYHIIGDIHGQAAKLENLLVSKLKYRKKGLGYHHPEYTTVFLGDYIDRGKQNRRTLEIVRDMVESGQAMALMGNHEFNAICYHTKHPVNGYYLRPHNKKNTGQHASFLEEFPLGRRNTRDIISWFRTLPLTLDLGPFRAVHACWDREKVSLLEKLGGEIVSGDCCLLASADPKTEHGCIIETLLKGIEAPLPAGYSFLDKDGNERRNIRLKWWLDGEMTYREAALVPEQERNKIPMQKIEKLPFTPYPQKKKPVFCGHYWFTGTPACLRPNVASLDYSAGNNGPLAAYCFHEQDRELKDSNFVLSAT